MSKHESQLLHTVTMRGMVTVVELARILGVSDQTIRRISKPLVARGELRKVHGALVSNRTTSDPPFLSRMNLNREAKVAIANAVANLIKDGDSLAIDTGSTSAFVAQALRDRRHLTVVTNSAFVASTLAMIAGNNVSMAGTQLRDHDGASFDQTAFQVIAQARVDYCVLSASTVNAGKGFLLNEQCEVEMAEAMRQSATRAIMAVDATKFQPQKRNPAFCLPSLHADDILVTDVKPPQSFAPLLANLKVVIGE